MDTFNCTKLPTYSHLVNLHYDYRCIFQFPYDQKSLHGFYNSKINAKQKGSIANKQSIHQPKFSFDMVDSTDAKENISEKKIDQNKMNLFLDDFSSLRISKFQKNVFGRYQQMRKIEKVKANIIMNKEHCFGKARKRYCDVSALGRLKSIDDEADDSKYFCNSGNETKAKNFKYRFFVADFTKLYFLHCDYQFQINNACTQFGVNERLYQMVYRQQLSQEHILKREHLQQLRSLISDCCNIVFQSMEGDEYDLQDLCSDVHVVERNSDVEQFKQSYIYLDMDALLEIEYLLDEDNNWQFMLQERGSDIFCNLCKCTIIANTPNIVAHLRSWNHRNIVKHISALYHPTYCSVSDDEGSDDSDDLGTSLYRFRALNESMSLEEFKRKYIYMDIYNLLDILFLNNKHEWVNMFDEKEYKYICNLCNKIQLRNFYDMYEHIRDSGHIQKMNKVEALYHPIYMQDSVDDIFAPDIRLNEIVNSRKSAIDDNIKEDKVQNFKKIEKETSSDLFKTAYRKLSLQNLLNVQYSMNFGMRKFMIIIRNDRYFCNLCGNVPVGDIKNLKTHIRGNKHCAQMECVVEMYDPLNSVWIKDIRPGGNGQIGRNSFDAETEEPNSLDSFKSEYCWLHTKNLLKIKYSVNSKDRKLMIAGTGDQYYCNLCSRCPLGNVRNVVTHIKESKHIANVDRIVEMYDPISDVWLKQIQTRTNGRNHDKAVSEQRNISRDNFKSEYIHLGVANLLKIHCKLDNDNEWVPMICRSENVYGVYGCNLCHIMPLGSGEMLRRHIRSDLHRKKIAKLQSLSHPKYCPILRSKGHKMKPSKLATANQSIAITSINATEFKENYVNLNMEELLKIQYPRANSNDWKYMLTEKLERYFCNLCGGVQLGTESNVRIHICGRNHSNKVSELTSLYHPEYCVLLEEDDSENYDEETCNDEVECDDVLEEFKENYVDLNMEELLEIEYARDNSNDWKYMLTEKLERYFCNLCGGVQLGTESNVRIHICGRNHSNKVSELTSLYHPEYCVLLEEDGSENYDEETCNDEVECDDVLEEFKENYVNLNMEELLKIQYPRANSNDWKYMLTEKLEHYFCNLCGGVQLGTESNVRVHICGRNHSKKLNELTSLYHPEYCVLFDENDSENYVSDDVLEVEGSTGEASPEKCCAVKPKTRPESLKSEISGNDLKNKNRAEVPIGPNIVQNVISAKDMSENGLRESEHLSNSRENKIDECRKTERSLDNFIVILRQLSAFQDVHGTIAPLTTNLLKEALTIQKATSDSTRNAFLNDENMLVVLTAREKLRGLIELDIIENPKILLAANKLISTISAFMQDENY